MVSPEKFSFLEERYQAEQDKRLDHTQGSWEQFFPPNEKQEHGKDPWIDYEAQATSEPLENGSEVKLLITGGGHSGLLTAVRVIEAGFDSKDVVIVDKAGGFGGTWYWNRYPGAGCDIESHCYMPLLEETGYAPKHRYSYGSEIREHAERIAKKWNIQAQFGATVISKEWNEATRRWVVSIRQTQKYGITTELRIKSQFVMLSYAIIPIPRVPKLEGLDEMRRNVKILHSSQWDYEMTGGTQEQPKMSKLKEKVVGIVGTGATAVQLVPQLARSAKHVYVFQRTPSFVGYREQTEITEEDWNKVAYKSGWQAERMINFDANLFSEDADIDLVKDGWTDSSSYFGALGHTHKIVTDENFEDHKQAMQSLDFDNGEKCRASIAHQVHDPIIASKLQPWYYGWCKRPTFHEDYLSSFNRSNVTLVDLDGKGLEKCTPFGPVANEITYNLDLLVFATGFFTGLSGTSETYWPFPIIGRCGKSLEDKFRSKEFETLHGVMSSDFPNLFLLSPRGSPASANLTSYFDAAAKHIAYVLRKAIDKVENPDKIVVVPTRMAEKEWSDEIAKRAGWYQLGRLCTPGYLNEHRDASEKVASNEVRSQSRLAAFGGGVNGYRLILESYHGIEGLPGILVRD